MKKFYFIFVIGLFALTGCGGPAPGEAVDVDVENEQETETFITLDNFNLNNHSRMIISEQGATQSEMIGSSIEEALHTKEFESGLMRFGREHFGEDAFLLVDNRILAESSEMDNFFKEHAVNVTTFFYYNRRGGSQIDLQGAVVGLQVNSQMSDGDVQNVANQAVETILPLIRESSEPVIFAVFRQQPREILTPGNFILKGEVAESSTNVGEWTTLQEQYYLFPSTEFTSSKPQDAEKLQTLATNIRDSFQVHDFFGSNASVFYVNNEMQSVAMNININFRNNTEVVALTQRIGELIADKEAFRNVDVEVTVASTFGLEAVVVKDAESEEVFSHLVR